MKHNTRLILIAAICAASGLALRAAPLANPTPVYAAPDHAATVLVTLPAGAEPADAVAATAVALPAGWRAIAITATLDVWVRDSDLNKELDVKPGSTLRAAPNADSAEAGVMAAGDVTELRGIQGKWVQMHIIKKTTGYIKAGDSAPPAPAQPPAPAPAPAAPAPADARQAPPQAASGVVPYAPNQTAAPAVQQPLSVSSSQGGAQPPPGSQAQAAAQPAPTIGEGRTYEARAATADTAAVPRLFEGVFASTKRPFMPRRPYDYQLTAPDGTRLVYVDLGGITPAGQVDSYIGRTVAVNGVIAPVPGTNDIVVRAETLQAK